MTWKPFETYIKGMFTPQCDHQKLQLYYTHHRHDWASDDQKNASSLRLHDHDMLFGRTSLNTLCNRYRSRSTCRNRPSSIGRSNLSKMATGDGYMLHMKLHTD